MATQQVICMNGGVGDTSYANNSMIQKKTWLKAKPILEENIKRMYCSILPKCLKVADLGCSSGPNTLQLVSEIINIVEATSSDLNLKLPVFQLFLNDLFKNDFNTIFNSLLPQFYTRLEQTKGHKFGPCFINATPGTFHNRLFPNDSIHFFHSSYSLHFLSQVPKELGNGEEAPNKGIYLTSKSPATMQKAYIEQFQCDFKLFLKLRSEELVQGGGMVLLILGRGETSELRTGWELIGMTLNDLLLENLIEEAKLESFYVPIYDPTIEEAKEMIEEEGSFTIQRLETVMTGWNAYNIKQGGDEYDDDGNNSNNIVIINEEIRGEFITKYLRAVSEPLLKAQFGEEIMDELYLRFKSKVVQLMMEVKILEFPILVISLTKNS